MVLLDGDEVTSGGRCTAAEVLESGGLVLRAAEEGQDRDAAEAGRVGTRAVLTRSGFRDGSVGCSQAIASAEPESCLFVPGTGRDRMTWCAVCPYA